MPDWKLEMIEDEDTYYLLNNLQSRQIQDILFHKEQLN